MGFCLCCHGALVPFGDHRKNGRNQSDWVGRQYHKKCWKTLRHSETFWCVPFDKKDDAKGCGAKWDAEEKKWFSPNDAVYMNMLNMKFQKCSKVLK